MKVEWDRVTVLSQIAAVVLFVGIFALGIYFGMRIEKKNLVANPKLYIQLVKEAA